jgi:hypothetical protein
VQATSGCLLTDSAGNVLLVKPTYKPPWEVPLLRAFPGGRVASGKMSA